MKIQVVCYGNVREIVGTRQIDLDVAKDATVESALDVLVTENPRLQGLREGPDSIIIMRDGKHLEKSTSLHDCDVLAISTSPMPE